MGLALHRDGIRALVKDYGRDKFADAFIDQLRKGKIKPEEVSIRHLWEGVVGDVSATLEDARAGRDGKLNFVGARKIEGLTSSAFPMITGALLAAKAIEGYNEIKYIGDDLVTLFPSTKKVDVLPGLTEGDEGPEEVPEGEEYEDSSFGEKTVEAKAVKRGRILSVTEETIMEDNLGVVLMKAQRRGAKMRLNKERRIIRAVTGVVQCYRPAGVLTDVYSSGNANIVTVNSLEDWRNVDRCLRASAGQKDENDDEIEIPMPKILVPRALAMTLKRILTATGVSAHDETEADQMRTHGPNPVAGLGISGATSVLMDASSATTWFMGDFKKAFAYKEVYPIQTVMAAPDHPDNFRRDIKFQFKIREKGDPFCIDPKFVYKNTAA